MCFLCNRRVKSAKTLCSTQNPTMSRPPSCLMEECIAFMSSPRPQAFLKSSSPAFLPVPQMQRMDFFFLGDLCASLRWWLPLPLGRQPFECRGPPCRPMHQPPHAVYVWPKCYRYPLLALNVKCAYDRVEWRRLNISLALSSISSFCPPLRLPLF